MSRHTREEALKELEIDSFIFALGQTTAPHQSNNDTTAEREEQQKRLKAEDAINSSRKK